MAETKTAVVSAVIFVKDQAGAYGQQYIFDVSFDNGDRGRYYATSQNQTSFVEGQQAEYTIESKINGSYTNYYIKPVAAKKGFGGGYKRNEAAENARCAMTAAVSLRVNGCIPDGTDTNTVADKIFNWLQKKSQM